MEEMTGILVFLGFVAFMWCLTLSSRISKLERQLRKGNDSQALNSLNALRDSLQKRIGECVTFDFYEDEEDFDMIGINFDMIGINKNTGLIRIIDVDEKWVYVHVETGKKKTDKLIRISSIKGIGQ